MDEFERLEQFAKLQKPPAVKFKDLEAAVSSSIRYNTLPFKVQADYIRITDSTMLTTMTIEFQRTICSSSRRTASPKPPSISSAAMTSIAGRVVNTFEDPVTVELPSDLLAKAIGGASVYQKAIPLAPGMYRLNVVCKDIIGGNMTTYPMALTFRISMKRSWRPAA